MQEGNAIHKDHRKRVRQRFQKEGLAPFEDHQALELLLFYAIPQKDTNPLAHRLIERFGSLKNVLDADVADLARVEGMGESSATLVRLVSDLTRRYWMTGEDGGRVKLTSIESAAVLARSILLGKPFEEFYVVCLDPGLQMKNAECVGRGTTTEAPVYVRHIVECAIRAGCDKVMVAHNHPGGNPEPSKEDIATTLRIMEALEVLSIKLVDHIIIAEGEFYSFVEHQLIGNGFTVTEARAAQYTDRLMQETDAGTTLHAFWKNKRF